MSNIAIKVENLSKQYRLGEVGTGTVSHDLNRWWHRVRGKEDPYLKIGETNDRTKKGDSEYVWALQDINFEVQQGEILGIIGKNGAGKSTLLKILSKVTAPTTGAIKAKGRIASLLEVGTGFHPELSGRENIYLNGTILGMTKAEVKNKLDEIVDFAGVERYVDTPVKRYSSGMMVRLGFAVAAHLEPEILIVDEVLAVGDAEFQKKAIGKMQEVSQGQGRTVLFVSHNMAAVKSLCKKGLVLEKGNSEFLGDQLSAISYYQTAQDVESKFEYVGGLDNAPGNENIRLLKFDVKPLIGELISISSGFEFEIKFFNAREGINLDITFELETIDNIVIFHHGTIISGKKDSEKGTYVVRGIMPSNLLNAGIYSFNLIFGENQRYELYKIRSFTQFEILNEMAGSNSSALPGLIRPHITYNSYFLQEV